MVADRDVETRLRALLDADALTAGLTITTRRGDIVLGRIEPPGPFSDGEPDDRVKLTPLGGDRFGLSVRRHTGRWEKTPFTGTLDELVHLLSTAMQHLIAAW